MAWAQSDLDSVRSAISSGVRKITFADGRATEYQSLDHLVAAERVISAELTIMDRAASGRVRRRFATFRSGL